MKSFMRYATYMKSRWPSRRLCYFVTLLLCYFVTLPSQAQDFKLYFANNITDVKELTTDIDQMPELIWREVKGGDTHDIAGNQVEVEQVMSMFADTRMKWLEDQQMFWRMRDHCLLCFRIDDCGKPGEFRVVVKGGRQEQAELTVSRTFLVNVCRSEKPVEISVNRVGEDESNAINFKYYVFDWDDQRLLTFQLDRKRQVTGEEYSLEYMLAWTDSLGNYQTQTQELKLKSTAFQSFYVPEGKDIVDLLLKTGNTGGEHKLRLNLKRLHLGVTTDPDFESVKLRSDFKLDKHEDRELVNFNWIGSGLYERYDTLFLTVFNNKNEIVTRATINANAVDLDGKSVDDIKLRSLGYDAKRKAFKVLTYGNPAYIEVIANGMCPAIYKYPGAADPNTHIVEEERCLGEIRLFAIPKSADSQGIIMSAAHLQTLHDTKRVVMRNNQDHQLCDIADIDITFKAKADTLVFFDDNGNNWLKLLNEMKVEHYAKLELTFSSPKAQAISGVSLVASEIEGGEEHPGRWPDQDIIRASDYPALQRDYYFLRYDMTEIMPDNKYCRLLLKTPNFSYDDFPCLMSARVDRDEMKKTVEDKVNETTADKTSDGTRAMGDAGFDLKVPASFKFSVQPLFITQSFVFDIQKQTVTSSTTATYNRGGMLKPGEQRPGESQAISDMRKEAKEYFGATDIQNGDPKDPGSYRTNFINDEHRFDDWVLKEMDDIFSTDANRIGQGWFGSFKFVFSMGMGPKLLDPKVGLQIQNCSGTIGYGVGLMVPDLLEKYCGNSSVASVLKKIPTFKIGANFELSAQLDLGVKKLNDKYPMSIDEPSDNFGYFASLSGKFKAGAWMEVGIPPNPILSLTAGLRAGGKIGIGFGLANRFEPTLPDVGFYLMGLLGIEAYVRLKTFFGSAGARAYLTHGARLFVPNNGHNPMHPKYPWWITDKYPLNAPAYTPVKRDLMIDAAFGERIVSDVAYDANPHLINDSLVVYNDIADPVDGNDNRISLLNTNTGTRTTLSEEGRSAGQHMRSKRGDHEIVVYEQLARPIQKHEVSGRRAMRKALRVMEEESQLVATMRKGNGAWNTMNITAADNYLDCKPVVTIQDDGHAACVWQRGHIKDIAPLEEGDTIYDTAFEGDLVMSFYDGEQWAKPVNLVHLNEYASAAHYDLMMRNDSVLVGISMARNPLDSARYYREFKFASIKGGSDKVTLVNDPINPQRFFMNRVGQHAVIAMLYEKNDSTRDIYVKTLRMNGTGDGLAGNDIGANYCSPNLVKIICDRSANEQNNFAILWTEMSNSVRGDSTELYDEHERTMLNASRITLKPTPHVTYPLTVGGEVDGLTMMDFDGYLDDSRIKVVYALADVENDGAAVLMQNEKYFSNNFEYSVGYTRKALLGSSTLPVSFNIRNTGTSPITKVVATVNDELFEIADSYVAPCHEKTFVVKYPIDDDFDGYLSTSATVEYDNLFRVSHHPKRRAMSYRRQVKTAPTAFVGFEELECRLVGQSVEDGENTFVVELTDHSSRGLNNNGIIHLGVYPHPGIMEPVSSEAEVVVLPSEFEECGGVRRTYATVKVPGVREATRAYLNIYISNQKYSGANPSEKDLIPNVYENENAHYVTLLPAADPSDIERVSEDLSKRSSAISVRAEEQGVRVIGLTKGDRLRIFASNGILVYSCVATSREQLVPIKRHDVYLLSSGDDILKFNF